MILEISFQNKFIPFRQGFRISNFPRAARARGDEISRFPYGFMRVSAAGAKRWKRTSFIKVLSGFLSAVWVLLRELAWRPFDLEQVFIGVERFPANVFLVKSHAQKMQFDT